MVNQKSINKGNHINYGNQRLHAIFHKLGQFLCQLWEVSLFSLIFHYIRKLYFTAK